MKRLKVMQCTNFSCKNTFYVEDFKLGTCIICESCVIKYQNS